MEEEGWGGGGGHPGLQPGTHHHRLHVSHLNSVLIAV